MCTLCFVLRSQEQTTVVFKAGQRCIKAQLQLYILGFVLSRLVIFIHTKMYIHATNTQARGSNVHKI